MSGSRIVLLNDERLPVQVLVLLLFIPLLDCLFRFVVAERMGTIILSAIVAHTGWHWMIERWQQLRRFRFDWPEVNAALLASAMRWTMLVLIVAGAVSITVWLVRQRHGRRAEL